MRTWLHNCTDAEQELERLRTAHRKQLRLIATMCGNPNAAEACWLILKEIRSYEAAYAKS